MSDTRGGYGTIELSPLSPDELTIVSEANELAQLRLQAAEAKHKAAYLAEMKAIQQAFEGVCAPVVLAREVGENDSIRFIHDENGVLCLEIVRRTRVPDLAPVTANGHTQTRLDGTELTERMHELVPKS